MKIMLIAEGSTPEDRRTENWGVSFLLGRDTLFDTFGKSERFMQNLRAFGVNISQIKHIVISHDDWDHTAGLDSILMMNKHVEVCFCPHANARLKDTVVAAGAQMSEARELIEIREEIYTTGEARAESDGRIIYEQSLFIRTSNGTTLVTGCAHPGIAAILEDLYAQAGIRPYCVIGGFHMKNASRDEIRKTVLRLKELGVIKMCPLHCTGAAAVSCIQDVFGKGYIRLREGESIEV